MPPGGDLVCMWRHVPCMDFRALAGLQVAGPVCRLLAASDLGSQAQHLERVVHVAWWMVG